MTVLQQAASLADCFDKIVGYVTEPNILRDLAGKLFDVGIQEHKFEAVREALEEFCEEWNIPEDP